MTPSFSPQQLNYRPDPVLLDGNQPVKIIHPMNIIQPYPRKAHWPRVTEVHKRESGGIKLNVDRTLDWNLAYTV